MTTPFLSRRAMLERSTLGFGSIALTSLLAQEGLLSAKEGDHTRQHLVGPHLRPRAKSIIFLFTPTAREDRHTDRLSLAIAYRDRQSEIDR